MDELITTMLAQFPNLAGLIILAYILNSQVNRLLSEVLERLAEMTTALIEMRATLQAMSYYSGNPTGGNRPPIDTD